MALLPLCLVLLSTALSISFKQSKRLELTPAKRRTYNQIHAFTTEVIQLLLLATGIAVTVNILMASQQAAKFSSLGFSVCAWLAIPRTMATYIIAFFAIDVIDNKIQLGNWQHPIQAQTLLLTRGMLLPRTIRWKKFVTPPASPRRTRAMSAPATRAILHLAENESGRKISTPNPGFGAELVSAFEDDLRTPKQLSEVSPPSPAPEPETPCKEPVPTTGNLPTPESMSPDDTSAKKAVHFDEEVLKQTSEESQTEGKEEEGRTAKTKKHVKAARHTKERIERRTQRSLLKVPERYSSRVPA